jgi:putative flippase GtrA
VDWTEDPDSRVDIVSTAFADLRGVVRMMRDLRAGRIPLQRLSAVGSPPSFGRQVARFAAIGVASTLAYVALFVLLRSAMPGQLANALALLVTAIGNTAANRRFTFAIRGSSGVARHQLQGLLVFGLALALTSGSLASLHALAPHASRALELAVLTSANLVATVLRFVLLRGWVFRARRSAPR